MPCSGTSRRSCSCATRRSLRGAGAGPGRAAGGALSRPYPGPAADARVVLCLGPSRRRGSRWAPVTNSQITITAAGTGAGSRCRPWWWRRRREPCQRGHRPAGRSDAGGAAPLPPRSGLSSDLHQEHRMRPAAVGNYPDWQKNVELIIWVYISLQISEMGGSSLTLLW